MSYGIKLVDGNSTLDAARLIDLQGKLERLYSEKGGRLTQADFENFLAANQLTAKGFSFQEIPSLAKPRADFYLEALGQGGLSPGAAIMALITRDAAEQRRMNKEIINQQTEEVVKNIEDQAKELRHKAMTQLVLGIIGGALTIAGGVASLKVGAGGLNKGLDAQLVAQRMQAWGAINQGVTSTLSAGSQFQGTLSDAKIKELEAKAERLRADRDILKEFNNSWNDLIQKTLNTSDAIQQSMNQARAKILG